MAIDMGRLRVVFLGEFEEHRGTLQSGLLELEEDPSAAERLLPELFRAAHSLKGGAQAVRLPAVVAVCHRLEEVLSGLRDGTVGLEPRVLESLLGEVDTLTELAAELHDAPVGDATEAARPGTTAQRPTSPPSARSTASAPAPAAPAASEPAAAPRARPSLRIPAERLDTVLDRAGDVLVARDGLTRLLHEHQKLTVATTTLDRRLREVRSHAAEGLPPRPAAAIAAADRAWQSAASRFEALRARTATTARMLHDAASGLEHSARTLRLQPFRYACDGFDRAVRDLTLGSQADGRRISLVVEGGDAELDSEVVTALREPLLHLVRNAVAHGIEHPDERRRAGKAEAGTVTIAAHVVGDRVQVSVDDDGRGLDVEMLRAEAAAHGIEGAEDEDAAARLAWQAGLSTAETPDELAGRGVGLDAVRSRIEQLGGTAELTSREGRGCTVTLLVPVTLSTLHALMVRIGDQTLAFPSAAVQRVIRVAPAAIQTTGAGPHVPVGDEMVRVASLRAFFGMPQQLDDEGHLAVLLSGPSGTAVLLVDRILDARRITRRGLHPRLIGATGIVGTTVLPNGDAALVLNPLACVREQAIALPVLTATEAGADTHASRVLLVEDSPTTRALEQDILERAGYDVEVAADGDDAWRWLREHGADLVVSDVEMPGMDGFSLCRAIRDHPQLGDVPVVLVTSRATDEDRHRGVEAGANAYLVKGAFDQSAFLATLERLL